MTPSSYLSLFLTISVIFFSHAIPAKSSPKLYQSVCKESRHKDFEQRCLKTLEAYPQITSTKDYLTFSRLYLKIVAIKNAGKAQHQVKEMKNKYPSSGVIKYCAESYSGAVNELKDAFSEEDPDLLIMSVQYAYYAIGACEHVLAQEKSVNTSSIYALNNEIMFLSDIACIASRHV